MTLVITIDRTRSIVVENEGWYRYSVIVPFHTHNSGAIFNTIHDCILSAYLKIIQLDGLPF
jgi:hypothetical protein